MTTTLEATSSYSPTADAVESRLQDETVILHLGSGIYFGLDAVGTVIWEQLQQSQSPRDICAFLRATFPDAPDTLESDVTAFLQDLLTHELIVAD